MNWALEVNNKFFYDKIEAIKEHNSSGSAIKFHTPSSYNKFDFTIEPTKTLEELCLGMAKKIRNEHEFVNLWYSGGCDSHYILQVFLENKIKIDKIIMVKSGYINADFEINDYAIPFIKKTNLKYEIRVPDQEYYKNFYIKKNIQQPTQNNFWHHFRLNNHFENLRKESTDTANIFGKEKTKLCFVNNKWYTYLLDVEVTHQPNQINFFCDDPEIYAKQGHMVMNAMIKNYSEKDYNHITNYNQFQNFWNVAMGRYEVCKFPLKEMQSETHINNKDELAIKDSSQNLLDAWKKRNHELKESVGSNWFNKQDPAFGTVGIFSNFFGLTENTVNNVDNLFPNGYKI